PIQLDFFDVGLIPSLEEFVYEKLDRLLKEIIASCRSAYKEHNDNELDYKALFRLIFRLIAAKLLGDRQYPGKWFSNDVREVIDEIEAFYFQHVPPESVLDDIYVQNLAWQKIRTAFSFRNLSVEALAYVYENTLVSAETRKEYGTHATPPQVAEYIVQSLPFEKLPDEERHVFELFCGHAPFLTAALGRLRTLPSIKNMSIAKRHEYFVQMLSGMELDSFACEVARNRLILADYPNPNGWRIANDNVFTSPELDAYLTQAQVILCNPPYEDFTPENRRSFSIRSANKAVEALRRALEVSPKMLGFVLPRVFFDGRSYREARKQVASLYDSITVVELPDNAFNYSDAETALLIAHGQRANHPILRSISVEKRDYQRFIYTGEATSYREASVDLVHNGEITLWDDQLYSIWSELASLRGLGEIADIHRGIEYNIPFEKNQAELVSNVPHSGFVRGLVHVTEDFEPYIVKSFKYLNTDPKNRRRNAYSLPWERPKVIANAARISADRWLIAGVIDEQGLICYQRFHSIWPKGDLPVEVISALLNGPVANAFLSTHRTSRDNKISMIKRIPVPEFSSPQIHLIVSLVKEYLSYRQQWLTRPEHTEYFEGLCRGITGQIDAELLSAYNLPMHLEQELVKYFDGYKRPGPIPLTQVKPSTAKRLYTSIIRIEKIRNEDGNKVLDAIIVNWNPHQTVSIPLSLVPVSLQERLEQDIRLLAKVNVGARNAEDLIFEDIRIAPEPKAYDGLA
ncbi:MAG TPA: N-6 DNA methylase, partial [Methylomirabilota bacterium]|nr:N-6 DNA methylase [Methylomirabilota bacterium]